jgi:UDPglucose 6-dehydrogenase
MLIGFVGMSHLGIVSAMGLAVKGVHVICLDSDEVLISQLQSGNFPIIEEDLETFYKKAQRNIHFSSDLTLIEFCDLVYISLDISTDNQGNSDTTQINEYLLSIIDFLKPNSGIVILSQVRPGFTRSIKEIVPHYLAYQVETLVFGKALERTLLPERHIIGLVDKNTELLPTHEEILRLFDCPVLKMNYESAELAKISINLFLASSILAANSLAQISESIGACWSDIEPSLRLDKRIGSHAYTTPGLGISGGNIERDIRAAISLASTHNCDTSLFEALESNSLLCKEWPSRILLSLIPTLSTKPKVAIWGLTYKSGTHSLKNSPALQNIARISNVCEIRVSDPLVNLPLDLIDKVVFDRNPLAIIEGVDVIMIFNDSEEFRQVPIKDIAKMMNGMIIIDPYKVLYDKIDSRFDYFTVGNMPRLSIRN